MHPSEIQTPRIASIKQLLNKPPKSPRVRAHRLSKYPKASVSLPQRARRTHKVTMCGIIATNHSDEALDKIGEIVECPINEDIEMTSGLPEKPDIFKKLKQMVRKTLAKSKRKSKTGSFDNLMGGQLNSEYLNCRNDQTSWTQHTMTELFAAHIRYYRLCTAQAGQDCAMQGVEYGVEAVEQPEDESYRMDGLEKSLTAATCLSKSTSLTFATSPIQDLDRDIEMEYVVSDHCSSIKQASAYNIEKKHIKADGPITAAIGHQGAINDIEIGDADVKSVGIATATSFAPHRSMTAQAVEAPQIIKNLDSTASPLPRSSRSYQKKATFKPTQSPLSMAPVITGQPAGPQVTNVNSCLGSHRKAPQGSSPGGPSQLNMTLDLSTPAPVQNGSNIDFNAAAKALPNSSRGCQRKPARTTTVIATSQANSNGNTLKIPNLPNAAGGCHKKSTKATTRIATGPAPASATTPVRRCVRPTNARQATPIDLVITTPLESAGNSTKHPFADHNIQEKVANKPKSLRLRLSSLRKIEKAE